MKFDMGYEENMSFFVIPKSPKVRKKLKVEKRAIFETFFQNFWSPGKDKQFFQHISYLPINTYLVLPF